MALIIIAICVILIAALQSLILVKLGQKVAPLEPSKPVLPSPLPFQFIPHEQGLVSIVRKAGDEWVHIGRRQLGHPDIHEALSVEGLAVQHPNGTIQETY